jgi:hypothetical protein
MRWRWIDGFLSLDETEVVSLDPTEWMIVHLSLAVMHRCLESVASGELTGRTDHPTDFQDFCKKIVSYCARRELGLAVLQRETR